VRLVNMGVEPFLITASTLMVGAQRLIRLLCPVCKEAYSVTVELKAKLALKGAKELTFYRPKGCPKCNNTGYAGRIAIMEALKLTPGIKELILQKVPEMKLKNAARSEGMRTLRENGLAKAIKGITSLEEILRVTAPDEELV